MSKSDIISEIEDKKELYAYQVKDIDKIFDRLDNAPNNYHLLYQLPTGGGKTVIFSEIVRRYLSKHDKKVVVLTHRIELCKQTSKMLKSFGVKNKIINAGINITEKLPVVIVKGFISDKYFLIKLTLVA